jgi:hypothetical protein
MSDGPIQISGIYCTEMCSCDEISNDLERRYCDALKRVKYLKILEPNDRMHIYIPTMINHPSFYIYIYIYRRQGMTSEEVQRRLDC